MNNIVQSLHEIERDYGVQVIFSAEVGSRIWGYATAASDYDVKFIYVYPVKKYLNVEPPKSVIEERITPNIELHGWDLYKACKLFFKSNPSLYEWLFSTVCYLQSSSIIDEMRIQAISGYSHKRLAFHYLNLAKKNIGKLHKDEKDVIHFIRGFLSAKWIITYEQLPPLTMDTLFKFLETDTMKEWYSLKRMELLTEQMLCNWIDELEDMKAQASSLKEASFEVHKINRLIWQELGIDS